MNGASMDRDKLQEGCALLSRALDGYLDREKREIFEDMLRRLTDPGVKDKKFTPKMEQFVRGALAYQAAHPEQKPAPPETPAVLRNLPLKPPGRK
jgi:hypothetical protein